MPGTGREPIGAPRLRSEAQRAADAPPLRGRVRASPARCIPVLPAPEWSRHRSQYSGPPNTYGGQLPPELDTASIQSLPPARSGRNTRGRPIVRVPPGRRSANRSGAVEKQMKTEALAAQKRRAKGVKAAEVRKYDEALQKELSRVAKRYKIDVPDLSNK